MAATSEADEQDGDTTAAGIAPATSSADEEDRTVQQPPDPKVRSAISEKLKQQPQPAPVSARAGFPALPSRAAPVAVPSAAKPAASPAVGVTSKKMTVVGLAPPQSANANASPKPLGSSGPTSTTAIGKPTASLLAAAKAPVTQKTPQAPQKAPNETIIGTEAEEEDASITATAPAPRVGAAAVASTGVKPPPLPPAIPLSIPGPVQIREMRPIEDEPLDETEVRTAITAPTMDTAPATTKSVSGPTSAKAPAPLPPADIEDIEDDEIEDSVTTQAPSQVTGGRLPEEEPDEPKTSPPMRMPPPIPAAGRSPFDEPPIKSPPVPAEDDDAYNAEESVTTRGPAVQDFRIGTLSDDSITAKAPELDHAPESSGRWPSPITPSKLPATMSQALGLPPAIEDGTEGTTNRGFNPPRPGPPRPSPSALQTPPQIGAALDDDDLHEDNRTAVMINAPVTPPSGSSRAARQQLVGGMNVTRLSAGAQARAPELHHHQPSSESGLRVAPEHQHHTPQPEERASLGAMMSGALQHHGQNTDRTSDRGSGVAQREYPSQPLHPIGPHMYPQSEPSMALGKTLPANSPHLQMLQQGTMPLNPQQMQQFDFASTIKKPRYGLLVGLVAMLSFTIPLVLFLWLHQNNQEPAVRAPAEVASDHVGIAPPSGTALAPAPPASSSAATKPPVRPFLPRRRN